MKLLPGLKSILLFVFKKIRAIIHCDQENNFPLSNGTRGIYLSFDIYYKQNSRRIGNCFINELILVIAAGLNKGGKCYLFIRKENRKFSNFEYFSHQHLIHVLKINKNL